LVRISNNKYQYVCKKPKNGSWPTPAPTLAPIKGNCAAGYHKFGNFCYKLMLNKKSWDDAKASCKQVGSGFNLASIHSQKENAFVASLLQEDQTWIGLLASPDDLNEFGWSDYTEFNMDKWASGQPSFVSCKYSRGSTAGSLLIKLLKNNSKETNADQCLKAYMLDNGMIIVAKKSCHMFVKDLFLTRTQSIQRQNVKYQASLHSHHLLTVVTGNQSKCCPGKMLSKHALPKVLTSFPYWTGLSSHLPLVSCQPKTFGLDYTIWRYRLNYFQSCSLRLSL